MGIWRCNFNPRCTSPSCDEMLAGIWSYCWNKGFASQLSRTRCHFVLQSKNSLVLGGVIICRRCLVPPTNWVSYQGCSATKSSGTVDPWMLILKSIFVKLFHSEYIQRIPPPVLSPCVGERWQLHVLSIRGMRVSWELIRVGWCAVKYKEAVSGSGDRRGKNCEGLEIIWWVILTCWLYLSTLTSTGPHFLKCWRQDIGLQRHSVCPSIAILAFRYLK